MAEIIRFKKKKKPLLWRPLSPTVLGVSVTPVLLTTTLSQALLSHTSGKRPVGLDACDSWYQPERGIRAIESICLFLLLKKVKPKSYTIFLDCHFFPCCTICFHDILEISSNQGSENTGAPSMCCRGGRSSSVAGRNPVAIWYNSIIIFCLSVKLVEVPD